MQLLRGPLAYIFMQLDLPCNFVPSSYHIFVFVQAQATIRQSTYSDNVFGPVQQFLPYTLNLMNHTFKQVQ